MTEQEIIAAQEDVEKQAAALMGEADPNSLTDLFSRDPEDRQEQDLVRIIAELRRMREKWKVEEAQGKVRASKPKAAPKSKAQKSVPLDDNFNLADLGLDL